MNEIDISVIIPVYNMENYLNECLNSILKQNFHSYEIICVDDASVDQSRKILLDFEKKYNRIKVITHAKNRGLSIARNTGMSYASGKYIWFVDSDDFIAFDSFKELYYIAEKNKVDIVYFDMFRLYEREDYRNIDDKEEAFLEVEEVCSGKELFCQFVKKETIKASAWRQFIKRDFLEKKKIKFYDDILHEDELFYFFCAMNAERVINVNKKYYVYRQREGSIMSTKNCKRYESLFVILVQILTYWNSHDFNEKENKAIGIYFYNLFSTFQYYGSFGKKTTELKIGGYIEKLLYRILQEKYKSRWLTLNERQLIEIEQANNVIVFGSGRAAFDIVNILENRNIKINVIAVSKLEDNPDVFCNIKVDSIDNISKYMMDAVVIIGVTEKYSLGIQKKLMEVGYKNILIAEKVM